MSKQPHKTARRTVALIFILMTLPLIIIASNAVIINVAQWQSGIATFSDVLAASGSLLAIVGIPWLIHIIATRLLAPPKPAEKDDE